MGGSALGLSGGRIPAHQLYTFEQYELFCSNGAKQRGGAGSWTWAYLKTHNVCIPAIVGHFGGQHGFAVGPSEAVGAGEELAAYRSVVGQTRRYRVAACHPGPRSEAPPTPSRAAPSYIDHVESS